MSWINKLYDTYENCKTEVEKEVPDEKTPLLPIAHTTQKAQIEVVINGKGNFARANVINKKDAETIIPCTEDSATRSGKNPAPHPLCDKLQYVAEDYSKFGGVKGNSFYQKYIKQLEEWVDSEYRNEKVAAILRYLKKGTLISDLVHQKVLICTENGKLLEKWTGNKNERPEIFKELNSVQSDAFVRFKVQIPDDNIPEVWKDYKVWDSYINYYLSLEKDRDLCYVQGEIIRRSDKHASKLRNAGDKAKLISANDSSGFTYRGRFSHKNEVVSIGYETTQKAHNALRWLVDKQGYKNGDQVIVAWGTKNQKVPFAFSDTKDAFSDDDQEGVEAINTEREFAQRLNKAIAGYGNDLDTRAEVVVMCLDSATIGRLAITYYRELTGSEFLERIKNWHSSCTWLHTYKMVPDGTDSKRNDKFKHITFIGAPAPKDIALAAYGSKVSDKLKKTTVERLLPCIIDNAKIPYDLVNETINRASRSVSMEKWEWEKALSIGCALVKKYRYDKYKEEWNMSLDENQVDRSYLFGRLLAVAHQIESWALGVAGESRDTNAERFMHQFKLRPYKTWGTILDKLRPYQSRLGTKGKALNELMIKINSLISFEDFTSKKPLEDSYILGFACQRQVFIDDKKKKQAEKEQKKLEMKNQSNKSNYLKGE